MSVRSKRRRSAGAVEVIALVVAIVVVPMPAAAAVVDVDASVVHYEPPIDAAHGTIIDRFRPPPGPYAAGNRGLEYATLPLATVRAAADGTVVFAGQVGGTLHVTVRHRDGLRTSYSFLALVDVVAGQQVRAGERLGLASHRLHFGVRDPGGTYLDPELLFGATFRVHLVPGGDDGTEPASRMVSVAGESASFTGLVQATTSRDSLDELRLWMHNAVESRPETHARRMAERMSAWLSRPDDCTPAGMLPPAPQRRRVLVEVGGIGSTSSNAAVFNVDASALGYAPSDVVRFSYRGGRVPAGAPTSSEDATAPSREPLRVASIEAIPASAYTAADSQGDLVEAATRLDDLLRRIALAAPGVPIDIVGHSQGGIVARLALDRASSSKRLGPEVQTLVTLGTPHAGADLAAVLASSRSFADDAFDDTLDDARQLAGAHLDPSSTALRQLVATSDLMRGLDRVAIPAGVRLTSIGARGDLVVPANRTEVRGAHHTVVPLTGLAAHDELPGSPTVTREIALAVAGWPPTCRDAVQVATDVVVSEHVSLLESSATVPAAVIGSGSRSLRWLIGRRKP